MPQADAERLTFFVDRSLGSEVVVAALRRAGERVVAHDEEFDQDTPDTTWLAAVGAKGWVVLTKDANIRTNQLEREALLSAGVVAFMLGRGDITGAAMATAFIHAVPRMKTVVRRWTRPLIAVVSVDGGVLVLYAAGEKLPRPRRVK